jgi:Protein prenyltransferase, alpha subunit
MEGLKWVRTVMKWVRKKYQDTFLRTFIYDNVMVDHEPIRYSKYLYKICSDFRREILKHLDKDLILELQYVKEMIENNPKNYQVWYVYVCVCIL